MDIIKLLYRLPKSCIYALVNKKKKYVYISYSKNFITSLSRNIKEMKDGNHVYEPLNKYKSWELHIIETLNYEHTLLDISCFINSIIETYKELGYNVSTHRNVMKVRFKVCVGQDFKVYCKLITKGYNEYIVGVFNNMEEAKDLIEQYRNMKVIRPLYSNNDLTKKYLNDL